MLLLDRLEISSHISARPCGSFIRNSRVPPSEDQIQRPLVGGGMVHQLTVACFIQTFY